MISVLNQKIDSCAQKITQSTASVSFSFSLDWFSTGLLIHLMLKERTNSFFIFFVSNFFFGFISVEWRLSCIISTFSVTAVMEYKFGVPLVSHLKNVTVIHQSHLSLDFILVLLCCCGNLLWNINNGFLSINTHRRGYKAFFITVSVRKILKTPLDNTKRIS